MREFEEENARRLGESRENLWWLRRHGVKPAGKAEQC